MWGQRREMAPLAKKVFWGAVRPSKVNLRDTGTVGCAAPELSGHHFCPRLLLASSKRHGSIRADSIRSR